MTCYNCYRWKTLFKTCYNCAYTTKPCSNPICKKIHIPIGKGYCCDCAVRLAIIHPNWRHFTAKEANLQDLL